MFFFFFMCVCILRNVLEANSEFIWTCLYGKYHVYFFLFFSSFETY
jgi:hypothetical protein